MRIALIHALRHSVEPAEEAFHSLWPTATVANILDDSLSSDLAHAGALTPGEFVAVGSSIKVIPRLVEGALEAMNASDVEQHDALATAAAAELQGCDVIALAQFSLARASPAIGRITRKRVLTTPDSAVKRMRWLLSAPAAHTTSSPTNLS
jgi:hypothetical protein